jgi:hypothetical protein
VDDLQDAIVEIAVWMQVAREADKYRGETDEAVQDRDQTRRASTAPIAPPTTMAPTISPMPSARSSRPSPHQVTSDMPIASAMPAMP